jgi:hypothetical protein
MNIDEKVFQKIGMYTIPENPDPYYSKAKYPVFTPTGEFEGWGSAKVKECLICSRRDPYISFVHNFSDIAPSVNEVWVLIDKQKEWRSRSGLSRTEEIQPMYAFEPQFIAYPKGTSYRPEIYYPIEVGETDRLYYLGFKGRGRNFPFRPNSAVIIYSICNRCLSEICKEKKPILTHGHLSMYKISDCDHCDQLPSTTEINIFNHIISIHPSSAYTYSKSFSIRTPTRPEPLPSHATILFLRENQVIDFRSPDHPDLKYLADGGVYVLLHPWPSRSEVD